MNIMTVEQKSRLEWVFRIVVSVTGTATMIAVLSIGWFLRDIYIQQKHFNRDVDERVRLLELHRAEVAIGKFTTSEWLTAKSVIDERASNLDKRITRTEDAVVGVREALGRIEAKLDKLEQRTR